MQSTARAMATPPENKVNPLLKKSKNRPSTANEDDTGLGSDATQSQTPELLAEVRMHQ